MQAFEKKKLPPLSFPEEFKKALKPGSGPGGRPHGSAMRIGFWGKREVPIPLGRLLGLQPIKIKKKQYMVYAHTGSSLVGTLVVNTTSRKAAIMRDIGLLLAAIMAGTIIHEKLLRDEMFDQWSVQLDGRFGKVANNTATSRRQTAHFQIL